MSPTNIHSPRKQAFLWDRNSQQMPFRPLNRPKSAKKSQKNDVFDKKMSPKVLLKQNDQILFEPFSCFFYVFTPKMPCWPWIRPKSAKIKPKWRLWQKNEPEKREKNVQIVFSYAEFFPRQIKWRKTVKIHKKNVILTLKSAKITQNKKMTKKMKKIIFPYFWPLMIGF